MILISPVTLNHTYRRAENITLVVLKKNSLTANGDKWNRQAYSYEEDKWRKSKVLGSLMGDEEDVVKRMALATVQFKSLEKVWGRVKSLKSRMNAYNAFVLPVLLFNAGAWGVCESVIKKIEVFHRKQLRRVLGVRWPFKISNKALYEKCGANPLGLAIRRFRWNLFGHVLRLSLDTPAQMAMDYYCNTKEDTKSRGRAVVTLPVLLFNEYHHYKCFKKSESKSKKPSTYKQKEATALRELRKLAGDRVVWAGFTKELCGVMEKL
jgi:hypothetical protein